MTQSCVPSRITNAEEEDDYYQQLRDLGRITWPVIQEKAKVTKEKQRVTFYETVETLRVKKTQLAYARDGSLDISKSKF